MKNTNDTWGVHTISVGFLKVRGPSVLKLFNPWIKEIQKGLRSGIWMIYNTSLMRSHGMCYTSIEPQPSHGY